MVDFYVQQMLDEWLRDVLVAENEPEHNRVGDVKIVKRFYVHLFAPSIIFESRNIHNQIVERAFYVNFANNRLQKWRFCNLWLARWRGLLHLVLQETIFVVDIIC
jgi:hypothetical protein